MRKRNHAYRRRSLLADPLALLRPAAAEKSTPVMLMFAEALDAVARGDAPNETDWRRLADAVNSIETLCLHMGKLVAAEVMPTVTAAIAALVDAAHRFRDGRRMGVDGCGLQALRDVIDIYGQCLESLTEREMALAQQITQQRMTTLMAADNTNGSIVSL